MVATVLGFPLKLESLGRAVLKYSHPGHQLLLSWGLSRALLWPLLPVSPTSVDSTHPSSEHTQLSEEGESALPRCPSPSSQSGDPIPRQDTV